MVKSMTGFGRASLTEGSLSVTVEIKAVNHRYFEFSSRLPRGCAYLEEKLKSFCQEKIARGKTEVSVQLENIGTDGTVVEINESYANAYMEALRRFAKQYGVKNDVRLSALVGNTELFTVKKQQISEEELTAAVLKAGAEAMDSFLAMRRTEGEKLAQDVRSRAELILSKVAFVEEQSPKTVDAYRERLEQKIKELLAATDIDEQRVLTETAVFADKVAVAEETVRLRSHIGQFCELLESEEPVGRKLDFIVQEMNRESNTIGSKAQDLEITRTVVDIKAEIEKIREQIQNIE